MADHQRATRRPGLAALLFALGGALVLIAACTAGNGRLEAIPLAPAEARELTGDQIPFSPEVVAEGFRSSLGDATVDIKVYSFPAASTFAPIVAHYQGQLPGVWHEQSAAALETARAEGRDATLWTNDDTGEVLSLQFVGASDLDGHILIVIYARRE